MNVNRTVNYVEALTNLSVFVSRTFYVEALPYTCISAAMIAENTLLLLNIDLSVALLGSDTQDRF